MERVRSDYESEGRITCDYSIGVENVQDETAISTAVIITILRLFG
jgi:hypothetical protein